MFVHCAIEWFTFMLFVIEFWVHLTQTTLGPPKLKKKIGGDISYYKNLATTFLNLCTVGIYCEGIIIVGEFTLFSKKFRFYLKHSSNPIADPIIRGVIEVTFCAILPLNGRFGDFLLWSIVQYQLNILTLNNKKCPKWPFRGEIAQKVTSMTPLLSNST